MPRMTERILYLFDLIKPYLKKGNLVDDAPQNVVEAMDELMRWTNMQDQ